MRTHLMHIPVHIERRLPRPPAIHGSRNASNMHIGIQHRPARIRRHRPHPQRWPQTLPIHNRRPGKPRRAPLHPIESLDHLQPTAPRPQAQHPRIFRPHIDRIPNSHTTRKLNLARGQGHPFAVRRPSPQRVPANNRKRPTTPIRRQPPHSLVRNLRCALPSINRKDTVAPRRHKDRLLHHSRIILCQRAFLLEKLSITVATSPLERRASR